MDHSEKGSSERVLEDEAYSYLVKFLPKCEGKILLTCA